MPGKPRNSETIEVPHFLSSKFWSPNIHCEHPVFWGNNGLQKVAFKETWCLHKSQALRCLASTTLDLVTCWCQQVQTLAKANTLSPKVIGQWNTMDRNDIKIDPASKMASNHGGPMWSPSINTTTLRRSGWSGLACRRHADLKVKHFGRLRDATVTSPSTNLDLGKQHKKSSLPL